jgi:anti-sigma regulatory factor (Ser/Thr protein kinase)
MDGLYVFRMSARKTTRSVDPKLVIAALLAQKSAVTSADLVAATGLTRQAVHRHVREMIAAGQMFAEGAGRGARYITRRTTARVRRARAGLDEAALYEELEDQLEELRALPRATARVLHYAFTEIVNNAIDHSRAKWVEIAIDVGSETIVVEVTDDGVGAFAHVRKAMGLASDLEAIGELSKGKTTTDPERHSGQGLFFSSKAVDAFVMESGALRWMVDGRRGDNAIASAPPRKGTFVRFEVARDTKRDLRALFDEYTTDHEFDRTRTVVRLFAYGVTFVSRSEAKRMLHGLDRFREVVLDFTGVDAIGQGFADEVFRVWTRAHAGTRIEPVHMAEPIAFMVTRAIRDRG